jgi:hypothetical protein
MFHGGTNPDGAKTTLQESQATGYPNDLPVKSYDFQAPLGEFGQENPSYRVLKTLHLFLADFGSALAPMAPYFPDVSPKGKDDISTPRLAARIQDDHGFLFINNHERGRQLPEHKNFQVKLKLSSGVLQVPRVPINVPAEAYAIWPVNLDLNGVVLRYATAQLLCRLNKPATYVFFALPGIAPELAFQNRYDIAIENFTGQITREQNMTYVHGIVPGTQIAVSVHPRNGESFNIVVLTREQALNVWKTTLGGKEQLILSPASLYFDENGVHLAARDTSLMMAGFYPGLEHPPAGFERASDDGVFQVFSANVTPVSLSATIQKVRDADLTPLPKNSTDVAMVPPESTFAAAARWIIEVPPSDSGSSDDLLLQIDYEGDIARLYAHGNLLTDNFYNGNIWSIRMARNSAQKAAKLELEILPLHDHAPIYLPPGAWPTITSGGQLARLKSLQTLPEYQRVMRVDP